MINSFYVYFQEALEKRWQMSISEHIREGAEDYKESRDRGR